MNINKRRKFFTIILIGAALALGGCKHKEEKLPSGDKPEPVIKQKKAPEAKKSQTESETPLEFTDSPDSGIRDIDFMNFIYHTEDGTLRFIGGNWSDPEFPDAHGRVRNVEFGQLLGNGREQAVVSLIGNWGGGAMETGYIVALDYHNGKAWQIGAAFEGLDASINDNKLQISRLDWDSGDPMYKPSLIVTSTYRWTGHEFKMENSKTSKR